MKTKSTFLVFAFIVLLFAAIFDYLYWDKENGKFFISVIASGGFIIAIITAICGDYLKEQLDPIYLIIELPEATNNFLDANEHGEVLCHHLRVENLTPHRAVKNCQVWLIGILDKTDQKEFSETYKFAVPRLMEWAPNEFQKEMRTFTHFQVFDFGMTRVSDGVFDFTNYSKQGGAFNGDCEQGKVRQYVFRIEADNYLESKVHIVEVRPLDQRLTFENNRPYDARITVIQK